MVEPAATRGTCLSPLQLRKERLQRLAHLFKQRTCWRKPGDKSEQLKTRQQLVHAAMGQGNSEANMFGPQVPEMFRGRPNTHPPTSVNDVKRSLSTVTNCQWGRTECKDYCNLQLQFCEFCFSCSWFGRGYCLRSEAESSLAFWPVIWLAAIISGICVKVPQCCCYCHFLCCKVKDDEAEFCNDSHWLVLHVWSLKFGDWEIEIRISNSLQVLLLLSLLAIQLILINQFHRAVSVPRLDSRGMEGRSKALRELMKNDKYMAEQVKDLEQAQTLEQIEWSRSVSRR